MKVSDNNSLELAVTQPVPRRQEGLDGTKDKDAIPAGRLPRTIRSIVGCCSGRR